MRVSTVTCLLALLVPVASHSGTALSLRNQIDDHAGYSGVWGAELGGVRLAIIGTSTGTAFVNVTDPDTPSEVAFIGGVTSEARTIRTHAGYAYIVSADGGGLQVVDLTLPLTPSLVTTHTSTFQSAASIGIEAEDDLLYACGTDDVVYVLDIGTPASPMPVTTFTDFPVEEFYVANNLGYAAATHGFAVLDLSLDVSQAPVFSLFAWVPYAGAATASAWRSDIRYVVTSDETSGGGLHFFEALNIFQIRERAAYAHPTDAAAVPGRVRVKGDTVYAAWHRAGLEVLDITDPTTPTRVAFYDSFTGSGDGLDGARDVYPLASTGIVYVSDSEGGLLLLEGTPAFGTVIGTLTDSASQTNGPAGGVLVWAPDLGRSTRTDGNGLYDLGLPAGTHEVLYESFAFARESELVTVPAGGTVTVDRTMNRFPTGVITGNVVIEARDGGRELHPEGTIVRVVGTAIQLNAGFNGFYILQLPEGTHVIEADRFGFAPLQLAVDIVAGETLAQDFVLDASLVADNLETDTGWTVGDAGDGATTGVWTRAVPEGTGGLGGYVQPAADETPIPGEFAFITGNGPPGDWIDVADVDGGATTLTSPVYDLTQIVNPIIRYYRWFRNDASWTGEAFDGDAFVAELSDDGGASWSPVESKTTTSRFWEQVDYVVDDYVSATDQVQLRFRVSDSGAPSIVEAAVDDVEIFTSTGMLVLPGDETPIDVASVTVRSDRPGTVTLRWSAPGDYERFDVERARHGSAPVSIGTVPGSPNGRYTFTDGAAPPGTFARYWITGFAAGDSERLGPFGVFVLAKPTTEVESHAVPNPTSGSTAIRFAVPVGGARVDVALFDASGRLVRTLAADAPLPGGTATLAWDGRDGRGRPVSSGVYLARVRVGDAVSTRRVVVTR